jgi:Xaa-Pro aminopeptidase
LIGCRTKGFQEFQCLFFTLDPGPLVLLTRITEVAELTDLSLAAEVRGWGREPEDPIDVAKELMKEKGFLSRRIGLEIPRYHISVAEYLKLKEFLDKALVMDATRLIEELKFVKSPAEIAYIRKAASIADEAMKTMMEVAREGITELEVAGEMHRTMMRLGSDLAASLMNLGSGERTAYCLALPSERRLKSGDFIVVEYGAAYKRYTATIGRQLCLGEPTKRMRDIYQLVRDASDAAIREIRAGVSCRIPHRAAKKIIQDAGMERYRPHSTGYGIAPGFPPDWRESVQMDDLSTHALEEGMVVCVEPPVFIPEEKLGVRLIDNLLVTKAGAEILSKFTRDLIIL